MTVVTTTATAGASAGAAHQAQALVLSYSSLSWDAMNALPLASHAPTTVIAATTTATNPGALAFAEQAPSMSQRYNVKDAEVTARLVASHVKRLRSAVTTTATCHMDSAFVGKLEAILSAGSPLDSHKID